MAGVERLDDARRELDAAISAEQLHVYETATQIFVAISAGDDRWAKVLCAFMREEALGIEGRLPLAPA